MKCTCPRCRLSSLETAGASKATHGRDVEVCGPCCSDEAWIEYGGQPAQKMSAWPVKRTYVEFGQRAWS